MRHERDFFGDQELVLVYIAKRLKEALALEQALDDASVDYLVEPDHYTGGVFFRSHRVGAFFYVSTLNEDRARSLLIETGRTPCD